MTKQLYWAYVGETGLGEVFSDLFDGLVVVTASSMDKLETLTKDDVVLFDGGTDINPELYNEIPHPCTQPPDKVRDERERIIFRRAQAAGAGCLGVCRGAQLLCALSGGRLIQHVTGHEGPKAHVITTENGDEIIASGDHHQTMFPYVAPEYELLAWASNVGKSHCEYGKDFEKGKEPEAVWFSHTNSLCIQPHPEWMRSTMSFPLYCRELVTTLLFYRR